MVSGAFYHAGGIAPRLLRTKAFCLASPGLMQVELEGHSLRALEQYPVQIAGVRAVWPLPPIVFWRVNYKSMRCILVESCFPRSVLTVQINASGAVGFNFFYSKMLLFHCVSVWNSSNRWTACQRVHTPSTSSPLSQAWNQTVHSNGLLTYLPGRHTLLDVSVITQYNLQPLLTWIHA